MADHRSLYKTTHGAAATGADESIDRRRRRLLDEQKAQRQQASDNQRGPLIRKILASTGNDDAGSDSEDDQINTPDKPLQRRQRPKIDPKPRRFNNHLQLSEWLRQRPDDFSDNWIVVACPRGQRCLVLAHNGRTTVYSKHGGFLRHFRSTLPGSVGQRGSDVTILDCVQAVDGGLWVLDALAYGRLDLVNCDAEFRFYWLQQQLIPETVEIVTQRIEDRVRVAPRADCGDVDRLTELLWNRPAFDMVYGREKAPPVDGLLFYHRESSYVHGHTPLVGWLFPFMVNEVLGWSRYEMHPDWLTMEAPGDDEGGALAYMDRFDAKQQRDKCEKQRLHRLRRAERLRPMDVDANDEVAGDADVDVAGGMLEHVGESAADDDIDGKETNDPELVS